MRTSSFLSSIPSAFQVPFESVQIDVQPVDFSVSGSLEYNHVKYDYQHAPSLNDLYQQLTSKLNQDYERHQLKMPPPSFFVARGKKSPSTQRVSRSNSRCVPKGGGQRVDCRSSL